MSSFKAGDYVTRLDGRKHFGSDAMVHRIGNPEAFEPYGGADKVFRHSTEEEIRSEVKKITR